LEQPRDPSTGQPPPTWQPPGEAERAGSAPAPVQPTRTSGKATASLVLGIIGILILPIVFSVLAIVFASIARREIEADPSLGGKGLATAGLVTGIVGLVGGLILVVLLLAA
jgi:hypothetical protein